jgi:hypothetical protein
MAAVRVEVRSRNYQLIIPSTGGSGDYDDADAHVYLPALGFYLGAASN